MIDVILGVIGEKKLILSVHPKYFII